MESAKLFESGNDFRRAAASIEQALISISLMNERVRRPARVAEQGKWILTRPVHCRIKEASQTVTLTAAVKPYQSLIICLCMWIGSEASATSLKLLLSALRSLGNVLEKAHKWRRAAAIYTQLKTLASRLLGMIVLNEAHY